MFRTGRRFAYSPSSFRNATLMLGAPSATPVAMGPFSAIRLRRTDSTASSKGNSPTRRVPSIRAVIHSHSIAAPAASMIRQVA